MKERPRVRRLDARVISKIAAGEMILSPMSVAKELLENSIDAEAARITIELGQTPDAMIRVIDDGIGMTHEDLGLALETHATSKLSAETDLLRVGSLGFRGEAIPSIGRVSRMEIVTSPDESGSGSRAVVEGGSLRTLEPAPRSRGTTVRASDLFFNSPVRKRFLKTAVGERRAIQRMIESYAYAHPHIHFRLVQAGAEKLDLPAVDGLAQRMIQLGGPKRLEQLLAVEDAAPSFRVHGFVAVPEMARGGTQHQILLVNRRWVSAPWFSAALRQAFGDLLPQGKNPLAVLLLEIDPSRIDVNVHPTKREIRFLDESELFGWIVRVVRDQVQTLVPTWDLQPGNRGGGWSRTGPDSSRIREAGPLIDALYRGPALPESGAGRVGESGGRSGFPELEALPERPPGMGPDGPGPVGAEPAQGGALRGDSSAFDAQSGSGLASSDAPAAARVFWQLHRRYILAQTEKGALVIDQHAAHERILYERTLARFRTGGVPTQQLLAPLTLPLEPEEMESFRRFAQEFSGLGLDVGEFGAETVLVRGVPALWSDDPEAVFRDVLSDLSGGIGRRFARREEQLAASFACRSAIKSGRPLSQVEMQRLVHDLFATEVPHGDPHGRPTYFEVDLNDFDRRFGRH